MGTPKKELYKMIEALPEEKIKVLKNFLESLLKTNSEDKNWLEADLAELPPYEWGVEGSPEGKNVQYDPEIGLIVKEGKG